MNLVRYQEWLGERWNGYPLEKVLNDSMVGVDESDPYYKGSLIIPPSHRALRSLTIITNGLCGEAGEAIEHFKKWVRDGRINKTEAGIELGDVLAYLTWCAKSLGYSLEDIAELNYDKLQALPAKGVEV